VNLRNLDVGFTPTLLKVGGERVIVLGSFEFCRFEPYLMTGYDPTLKPNLAQSAPHSAASISAIQPIGSSEPQAPGEPGFADLLAQAEQPPRPVTPPVNRWQTTNFLTMPAAPQTRWPWLHPDLKRELDTSIIGWQSITDSLKAVVPAVEQIVETVTSTAVASVDRLSEAFLSTLQPMALADYPRPAGDNGMGVHWIPTVRQTPAEIDHFVEEAKTLGMKWVLFLNEGTDSSANDYLVKKLTQAGIEPMMRIYTPGLTPIAGDLQALVRHYRELGVRYFQLYNEPNLMVETGGQFPDVEHYLELWVPAAKEIIAAGGLPGFGALSPQGEMDDRDFLRQALAGLEQRGLLGLLNRSWLSMHNYTGPRALDDPNGFMRFRQYNAIIESVLGRSIPIIGTEGGTHITEHVSEAQQVDMVTGAYKYMRERREPWNFAYTYWILANGHDPTWDEHALIRRDGPTALAQALKRMASNS
jgi:hypothetical protein